MAGSCSSIIYFHLDGKDVVGHTKYLQLQIYTNKYNIHLCIMYKFVGDSKLYKPPLPVLDHRDIREETPGKQVDCLRDHGVIFPKVWPL